MKKNEAHRERTRRARESRSSGKVPEVRRAVKVEKSTDLSRARCIHFDGRKMARRARCDYACFNVGNSSVFAGEGVNSRPMGTYETYRTHGTYAIRVCEAALSFLHACFPMIERVA